MQLGWVYTTGMETIKNEEKSAEDKFRETGEAMSVASEARANVAAEKFVASLPKTSNAELDKTIANIARVAYLQGRAEVILSIMHSI